MKTCDWTDADTAAARRIWEQYQQLHDLSERVGQMAGIDPKTGNVWFGEWVTDITAERRKQGLAGPLFFERVGYPTGLRIGLVESSGCS
ncbi:MAG: hypothetical protein KY476_07830 [Planctomycetes bacterium]|nr:hypothetical protein [Planctomycetota bacterium]